jgi:hypothetical protein
MAGKEARGGSLGLVSLIKYAELCPENHRRTPYTQPLMTQMEKLKSRDGQGLAQGYLVAELVKSLDFLVPV